MASVGVDFKLKNIEIDGKKVKIQIWDTAGQERYKTITTSYYRGANSICIVYDITDSESFEHIKNWIEEIHQYAKDNVMLFLVGNKNDLESKRQISKKQGEDLASQYNMFFLETSAKLTNNIEDLFVNATRAYINKSESMQKSKNRTEIEVNNKRITTLVTNKKKNSVVNISNDDKDDTCCK